MILIDSFVSDNFKVNFYDGIDFNVLKQHPKDGSYGIICCFIENYTSEVESYNRNSKIKSILDGSQLDKFDWNDLDNDFIHIYQTEGLNDKNVYRLVKEKLTKNHYNPQQYYPIDGFEKGAWRIK